MAMSAFGVEDSRLSKAWQGEKGDKRNTKYAGAALAGNTVGGLAGGLGAKLIRLPNSAARTASEIGGFAGIGGGVGAYAGHRRKKGMGLPKSES